METVGHTFSFHSCRTGDTRIRRIGKPCDFSNREGNWAALTTWRGFIFRDPKKIRFPLSLFHRSTPTFRFFPPLTLRSQFERSFSLSLVTNLVGNSSTRCLPLRFYLTRHPTYTWDESPLEIYLLSWIESAWIPNREFYHQVPSFTPRDPSNPNIRKYRFDDSIHRQGSYVRTRRLKKSDSEDRCCRPTVDDESMIGSLEGVVQLIG